MDETWARSYETNFKSQSNEWKYSSSPHPKKVCPIQCALKVMFTVAYDDGVILYHAVLSRQTVNSAYNCTLLQHHLHPALRRKLLYLVVENPIVLHDNARSHTAATVTASCAAGNVRFWIIHHTHLITSPCDYDIRQSERTTARDSVQYKR